METQNETQAIVKSEDTTAEIVVPGWGRRDAVKEMAFRLLRMMPGAQKLTPTEAYALAQIALVHGLDPWNGEVWALKDKEGNSLGVMVGIKGHRRAAKKELEKHDPEAVYFLTFERLRSDECIEFGYSEKAIGYACMLRDNVSFDAWVRMMTSAKAAGLDNDACYQAAGKHPVVIGYGFFDADGEFPATKGTKPRPGSVAMRRAEADALKRRFSLPFEFAEQLDAMDDEQIEPTAQDEEYLEAEAAEVPYEELPVPVAEKPAKAENRSKALTREQVDALYNPLGDVDRVLPPGAVEVGSEVVAGEADGTTEQPKDKKPRRSVDENLKALGFD